MITEYEPQTEKDPLQVIDGKWNYNHNLYSEMTLNERLTLLEKVFDLNGDPLDPNQLPDRTEQWKSHLKSFNHQFKN